MLALGLDYGTESGRVMLVDASTGAELAWRVVPYPHGVMERALPDGTTLAPDWALQHPADYLHVLEEAVPAVLAEANVTAERIVGIGVDFTASTPLPTRADGTPLCQTPEFSGNLHSWVKLWKHHAAEPQAKRINAVAKERNEPFLELYRGGYSSEWMFSKILETLEEAPEVYAAADRYLEACDWLVWQLTGVETRSECAAGYKGMWSKSDGYPSPDFFGQLNPELRNVIADKVDAPMVALGESAGGLTAPMAERLGLREGTPVAAAVIDAHAALPACGVSQPGRLAMIMGTSNCHMLLADERKPVEGMAGFCQDGILPGFWGYEGGQAAVGDIYGWFFRNGLTAQLADEAASRNISPEDLLTEKAAALKPGESGLLALDWWNGCRSTLMDADLSGLLVGYSLTTRPEEIYRALIEATAFGTRAIIETFESQDVSVEDIVACGGLAEKSPLVVQIFADVTGRTIRLPRSFQASGLGAAIHGAVAAGHYPDFQTAVSQMGGLQEKAYEPDADAGRVYDQLYADYRRLHDHFGRGGDDIMKRLKALRRAQSP